MKGVIFVELLRMAEANAGEELVDEVLDSLTLESGGPIVRLEAILAASCSVLLGPLASGWMRLRKIYRRCLGTGCSATF